MLTPGKVWLLDGELLTLYYHCSGTIACETTDCERIMDGTWKSENLTLEVGQALPDIGNWNCVAC